MDTVDNALESWPICYSLWDHVLYISLYDLLIVHSYIPYLDESSGSTWERKTNPDKNIKGVENMANFKKGGCLHCWHLDKELMLGGLPGACGLCS